MERIKYDFRYYGIDLVKEFEKKVADKPYGKEALETLQEIINEKPDRCDFVLHIPDQLKETHDVSPLLKEYEYEDLTDFV